MRTILFGAAFGAAALTSWITVLSAQQPPSPANEPAHKVYAMTGCLESGADSNSAFKLTGAKSIGQAPAPGSGSTGTSTTDTVYELQPVSTVGEQGISRDRLQSHVGKRVEVTIRPVEVAPAPPSTQTTTGTTSTGTTGKPAPAAPQRYTVVKIDQLAESCK